MNAAGSRYKRPMTRTWWLRNPRYTLFMLRELTAILILAFVVLYLAQLIRLGAGQASYNAFLDLMESPLWIALHVIFLLGAILHSVTWMLLVPRAMPEFVLGIRIPPGLVLAGGFAAWIAVSAAIIIALGVS